MYSLCLGGKFVHSAASPHLLPKLPPYAFLCCQALQFAKHKTGLLRVAIHKRVLVYLFAFLYDLRNDYGVRIYDQITSKHTKKT